MQTLSYTNARGLMPAKPTHVFIVSVDEAMPIVVLRIPKQSLSTHTSNA